jgi:hypothetical protein
MTSPFPFFNGTLKSFYRLRETEKKEAKKEIFEDVYSLLPRWTQSNILSRHTALDVYSLLPGWTQSNILSRHTALMVQSGALWRKETCIKRKHLQVLWNSGIKKIPLKSLLSINESASTLNRRES